MKYIIANWKSHKNHSQVASWISDYESAQLNLDSTITAVIAPPLPSLMFVSDYLLEKKLQSTQLAVQDISPFPNGAYTGAVSAQNLEGLSVKFALVGHSERRRYFHETHQEIANKIDLCLQNSITPIVCIDTEYVVEQAAAVRADQREKCMVAYEDLAAIGTGDTTPIEEVKKQFAVITHAFGEVPLLYGGSVNAENVNGYLAISDGVLVGTASLKSQDFISILKKVSENQP